jgi:membrane associated rhomboid family serine protease
VTFAFRSQCSYDPVAVSQEHPEAAEMSRTPGQAAEIRDGAINFSDYSSEQLKELRYTLNQIAFPLNYANLLAEIERRATTPVGPSGPAPTERTPHERAAHEPTPGAAPQPIAVLFTSHGGLRGWLEAKSRRISLYGEGFAEIRSQEIVLGGWQHNWLGIAHRTEVSIPLQAIVDVIQGDAGPVESRREGDWVRFRYETALGRYRVVEFRTASVQQASEVVDALPKARSDGYERWTAVREFHARLREAGGDPWITPALASANVVVFAVIALILKRVDLMNAPQVIVWGANFAPMTLHGQWWRLLSALFLHANVAHVFFNMWALWNIGRLTERLYGNWAYAFLYFSCGVLSGLASIVWEPSRATVGASGAIFGIFAAFIVFAIHPHRRTAIKVPAALWISALIFALYNLIAGFFNPGIDNAAHVGGVISGLVLGVCLARPLTPEARSRFPVRRVALAGALTAVGIIAALWQATGFGSQLTGPERYLRDHSWYVNGETENLRKWQAIVVAAGSGQLSDYALGDRFEQEIVPFWQTARARLKQEEGALPANERQFGALLAEYARVRLEWARGVVEIAHGNQKADTDGNQYEKDSNLVIAQTQRVAMLASLDHRTRALTNARWVITLKKWLTGQHWQCVRAPALTGNPTAPEDSRKDGPAALEEAGCRAQGLFTSGDYATLDRWIRQSAASLQDLPDGSSTLDGITRGLRDLFDYQRVELIQVLGRTADWQRATPQSPYPELIQSLIFESWAWAARGHGGANSVSPQAWALFAMRTEMAAMGLRELADRAKSHPLWYQLSLDVGLDQSKSVGELRAIFDRGVLEQPDYWPLYRRMLRILMPRWLGSDADVQRFIRDISVTADGQRDFEKYARLYWTYSSLEEDNVALFDDPLATWSVMKEGFEELRHDHPHSDVILNAYAKFACMANDGDTYKDARVQLNGHISSAAWTTKVSLQHCDGEFAAATAAARGHKFTPPKVRLN